MPLYLLRWIKITLINLCIVAAIGVTLRYKIAYSLPFVDQKHLLHGHSHFAFAGWITQALMVLLTAWMIEQKGPNVYKKYRWILLANLCTAFGMLISFPIQGYGLVSILFSTASIFVSYAFAWMYWKDLNTLPVKHITQYWFKMALACNAFSSLGAFGLAYMMAAKNALQNWHLAAEYFYLHFQYNGWFFFACMGLLMHHVFSTLNDTVLKKIFWLFAFAVVPAYFLSTLWMQIPVIFYLLVIVAVAAQLLGWWLTLITLKKLTVKRVAPLHSLSRLLWIAVAVAFTVKLLLQSGSTIPSLSILAFGFRPIVIGYLHLVLLGVITLFLLGYMFAAGFIATNRLTKTGALIFAAAIILNEILLMVQGVAAIDYFFIPYINQLLLFAAVGLFSGICILVCGLKNHKRDYNHI